jgi:ribosomal protein L21
VIYQVAEVTLFEARPYGIRNKEVYRVMINLDTCKSFISNNWKYLLGLIAILAVLCFGYHEYKEWKQYIIDQSRKVPTQTVVTLPPQVINTKTETIREVVVQAPSQEGAILQFVERQGKIIAIVNGQEVEVPNVSGQPDIKIGENGELRFSTSSTTKIDVTDMANAQARLIVNQELEKQSKIHAEEMKKEKSSRKKERIGWILSTAVGGYFLTR